MLHFAPALLFVGRAANDYVAEIAARRAEGVVTGTLHKYGRRPVPVAVPSARASP